MRTFLAFSILATTVNLMGCSSTPDYAYNTEDQYCYQTTKIYTQGENISSEGITECTDKPRVEHIVKDVGVANNCRISRPLDSNRADYKGGETLLCQFTDSRGQITWRPVNEAFAYPNFN